MNGLSGLRCFNLLSVRICKRSYRLINEAMFAAMRMSMPR